MPSTSYLRSALSRERFDVIVSDIAREGSEEEGLDAIEVLNAENLPFPPVIFYVGEITPARKRRASRLNASLVNSPTELLRWLEVNSEVADAVIDFGSSSAS